MKKYASPAIEYSPMFFRQIMEAFLVRTDPDSSIVNPAHIHITSAPKIRNEKVLKTNRASSSTPLAAWTTDGRAKKKASETTPVVARMRGGRRQESMFVSCLKSNLL